MKLKLSRLTLLLPVLASTCVGSPSEYCTLTDPILFGSEQTINWLARNDERMLQQTVTHNETYDHFCLTKGT